MTTSDRIVGTAETGGRVEAGGDIVGGNKTIFYGVAGERSPGLERSHARLAVLPRVPFVSQGLREEVRAAKVVDLAVDLRSSMSSFVGTDRAGLAQVRLRVARSADSRSYPHLRWTTRPVSALESIAPEFGSIVLHGERGSGKSTILRRFSQSAPERTLFLDCSGTFGEEVDTAVRTERPLDIPWLQTTLLNLYGVDLSSGNAGALDDAYVIVDHAYHLRHRSKSALLGLLARISERYTNTKLVIAARRAAEVSTDSLDLEAVEILPLTEDIGRALAGTYSEALAALPHDFAAAAQRIMDRWYHVPSETAEEFLAYVESTSTALDANPTNVDYGILSESAKAALWRLFDRDQLSFGYYEVLHSIDPDHSLGGDLATGALELLCSAGHLEANEGKNQYSISRSTTTRRILAFMASEFLSPETLVERALRSPAWSDVLAFIRLSFGESGGLRSYVSAHLSKAPPADHEARVPDLLARYQVVTALCRNSVMQPFSLQDLNSLSRDLDVARNDTRYTPAVREDLARCRSEVRTLLGRTWGVLKVRWVPRADLALEVPTEPDQPASLLHCQQIGGFYASTGPITNSLFAHYLIDEVPQSRIHAWRWNSLGRIVPHGRYDQDPVVGITFSEASRFCEWLSTFLPSEWTDSGYAFRLPTIAEWEAIRHEARDLCPANTPYGGAQLGRPTPVGLFGGSSDGTWQDIAGNVMEWTTSGWPGASIGRGVDVTDYDVVCSSRADGMKLLKGGSWLFGEAGPRCACVLPVETRFEDVGFRPILCSESGSAPQSLTEFEVAIFPRGILAEKG